MAEVEQGMVGIKVLPNKIIQVGCLIALMATSITGFAQDDGFYVIPFPTGIKEVCNGTAIGDLVFSIYSGGATVHTGQVYSTTEGHLVEITGGSAYLEGTSAFRESPSTLPEPTSGVKGAYYILSRGSVAFARFL